MKGDVVVADDESDQPDELVLTYFPPAESEGVPDAIDDVTGITEGSTWRDTSLPDCDNMPREKRNDGISLFAEVSCHTTVSNRAARLIQNAGGTKMRRNVVLDTIRHSSPDLTPTLKSLFIV